MANKFADEVMAQFTGERGPFDSRFAFVSTRDGKFKEVYVMSPDEGDLQQITRNQTLNVSPSWSPDSRSLLYTSYKRRNPDLFLIDLISGRETLLSQRPGLESRREDVARRHQDRGHGRGRRQRGHRRSWIAAAR